MELHQHQFKPFELYESNGIDSLLRGLLMQPAQKIDRAFSSEVNILGSVRKVESKPSKWIKSIGESAKNPGVSDRVPSGLEVD